MLLTRSSVEVLVHTTTDGDRNMDRRHWFRAALLAACAVVLQGSNCIGPIIRPSVDEVTRAFDNAIASLGSESGQWRATLQQLESNLVQQGQSTLANEVQSVLNRGIAAASLEVRCDVKFLASQLSEALQAIMARFENLPPPALMPHFCSVDPSAIDLRIPRDRRPATINIYGFNLSQNNVSVAVFNADGSHSAPPPGIFSAPTEFQATFNIVNYEFSAASRYLSFALLGGEERRIGITQLPDCGSVDQSCCREGAPCTANAGCLDGHCVVCPPPAGRPVTQTLLTRTSEFSGKNCLGRDEDRTYGGACSSGFHREQCRVSIVDACDSCTAASHWANSTSDHDCTCVVHFHTPADCFKGIYINLAITQTQDVTPRPVGCP